MTQRKRAARARRVKLRTLRPICHAAQERYGSGRSALKFGTLTRLRGVSRRRKVADLSTTDSLSNTASVPETTSDAELLADERLTAIGLLVEAEAALVRILDSELRRDCGMALSTFETLIRLARSPDRRLRQYELGRQVSLTTGGVTRLIDRIEAAGYVRRVADPTDRRGNFIELTPAGHEALLTASRVHLPSLQRHLVDPLGSEGLAQVVGPLRLLRNSLIGDPASYI